MKKYLPDALSLKLIAFEVCCFIIGLALGISTASTETDRTRDLYRNRSMRSIRNMKGGRRRIDYVSAY